MSRNPPYFSVVADNATMDAATAQVRVGALSERVKRLQAEAKALAREHVQALEDALAEVERLSAEIAEGGEAYPPGVRDIARRLVEECESRVQTLEAIVSRT
jgi:inorganic triphosphatase YgiF